VRLAGVTLPLFSIRTSRDWGIGQITDLPAAGRWIRSGGFRLLQILPAYELARGETSPYGARTAFGIDPIYIDIDAIPGMAALSAEDAAIRDRLRALPEVDHGAVRDLKLRALRASFELFWERGHLGELRAFAARESAWEDDLALYVAIRHEQRGHGWETWPAPERNRDPAALDAARARLAKEVSFHQWMQWNALGQWDSARRELEGDGISLMGDLPFVVGGESADVWAHRELFQLGKSLGAPPDEFDPELGQDWGLPPYDWEALDRHDLWWLRARAAHAGRLYHAFRVDHVIGYFRQYVRPPKALGVFDPAEEAAAEARGRRLALALRDSARPAAVIAEDLGVIPKWARKVLDEVGLPGYRVLPWEKDEDGALRDPRQFPPLSVATWSTHDTAPIGAWWNDFDDDEKGAWATRGKFELNAPADARNLALARILLGSGSDIALMLAPEVLGESARINTPGSIGAHNWTYRLPRTLESLSNDSRVTRMMGALHAMNLDAGRVIR
jgi:4-alpha-glucanotransferase